MPSPPRSRRPAARLVALLICAGAIAAAQAWAQAPPPGPAPYQREGATDLTMKGLFPAFASPQSRSDTWLASLDEMERLKPRIVVGAHYDIGDASDIEAYRVYLKALRARAAELKKTASRPTRRARLSSTSSEPAGRSRRAWRPGRPQSIGSSRSPRAGRSENDHL